MPGRRLKILASAYACHPAPTVEAFPGEAILGWNLAREISRRHDLHVLTMTFNRPALETAVRRGAIENVKFHFLDLPPAIRRAMRNRHYGLRLYYFFWQVMAGRQARRLQRKETFDLFHHLTFSNDWMPSYAGDALSIPFVWGPVGGGQSVPKPLLAVLSRRDARRERLRVLLQRFWRMTPARRRCARKAAAILVCNEETRADFRAEADKLWDFPVNGISVSDLASAEVQAGAETAGRSAAAGLRVLYAGRLDGIKGLSLGLRGFQRFVAEFPSSTWEVIGEGPEKKPLERLAAELAVSDKVSFRPWLSREELASRMKACDVVLFPSLRDGGGAVVVEAMALGKPVVSLDVGGPGFHLRPEWGIKIPCQDPSAVIAAIAAALAELGRDPERRARLGSAARQRAAEFYLWERLGERVDRVYQSVLEKRG